MAPDEYLLITALKQKGLVRSVHRVEVKPGMSYPPGVLMVWVCLCMVTSRTLVVACSCFHGCAPLPPALRHYSTKKPGVLYQPGDYWMLCMRGGGDGCVFTAERYSAHSYTMTL